MGNSTRRFRRKQWKKETGGNKYDWYLRQQLAERKEKTSRIELMMKLLEEKREEAKK